MRMRWWIILGVLLWAEAAVAEPPYRLCSSGKWGQVQCIRPEHFVYYTCNALQIFADRHKLDRDFFARLIWQESLFDPNAHSPANARGIAQFIPSTADLRGLNDPFNPADALEHAAQYLSEMVTRFGNEGLAAVGYNGGEARAASFIKGENLASETDAYVPLITGLTAQTWRDAPPARHDMSLSKTLGFHAACTLLAVNRKLSPPARPKQPRPRQDLKPWGVQVAFGISKQKTLVRMRRRPEACLALGEGEKIDFTLKEDRMNGKAGFFYAQIGLRSKSEAQSLCDALRAQDCLCLVIKN